jgi:hypothetical protein
LGHVSEEVENDNNIKFEKMKKFELIVGFIAILGIFLKILHIQGSELLIVLSFSALSTFYYVFSFAFFNGIRLQNIFKKESYKDTNAKRIIGAVGLGISLSTIIMGGLFKLLFWAGANMQLMTGLVILGIILPVATIFYFRNKEEYYKRIFKRIVIYGGIGLFLFLMPSSALVDIYYRNYPDYAELYKKVLDSPKDLELREQLYQKRTELRHPELKIVTPKDFELSEESKHVETEILNPEEEKNEKQ